jgi:hypothetical protein
MITRKIFLIAAMGIILAACVMNTFPARGQAPSVALNRSRLYNPGTEVHVKGKVISVEQATGREGWAGTHFLLDTDKQTLDVHVGPSWFLAGKKVRIAAGDQLEIIDSRVRMNGKDTLLARQIIREGTVVTLRDAEGIPLWSRQGCS